MASDSDANQDQGRAGYDTWHVDASVPEAQGQCEVGIRLSRRQAAEILSQLSEQIEEDLRGKKRYESFILFVTARTPEQFLSESDEEYDKVFGDRKVLVDGNANDG